MNIAIFSVFNAKYALSHFPLILISNESDNTKKIRTEE